MPVQVPDLWPEDFGQLDMPTPLSILKQQGVYLGQRTNNVVIGQVRSLAGADFVRHYFELSAPLMAYNYDLFTLSITPSTFTPWKSRAEVYSASPVKPTHRSSSWRS
jgi:hypothetical protein